MWLIGTLKRNGGIGGTRETFFANQVKFIHKVSLHPTADFLIDDSFVVEIGEQGENKKQIKIVQNGYLAVDDIEVGFHNRIPLYLFGFLY